MTTPNTPPPVSGSAREPFVWVLQSPDGVPLGSSVISAERAVREAFRGLAWDNKAAAEALHVLDVAQLEDTDSTSVCYEASGYTLRRFSLPLSLTASPRVTELEAAVKAFVAWLDAEDGRPDYEGLTRDTHPNGNAIWWAWWNRNQALCAEALRLGRAALPSTEPRADG